MQTRVRVQAASTSGPTPGATPWYAAVAIGWTAGFGAIAAVLDGPLMRVTHVLALAGPLVALGVVLARSHRDYRRTVLRRVVDPRPVSLRWWGVAVALGVGPGITGWLLTATDEGVEPGLSALSLAGIAGFALAAGLVEEPGWRGVAQDGLAGRTSWLPGALLLAALWSAWHLPLYFVPGTFQHELGAWTAAFWVSMLVRVPLGVLLFWLVRGARGAVVVAVAAHALGNLVGEILAGGTAAMVVELVLLASAATIVAGLSGRARRGAARASSLTAGAG